MDGLKMNKRKTM